MRSRPHPVSAREPAGNRPTDPVEDTSVSQASGQTGNPRGSRTSSLSGMDSGGSYRVSWVSIRRSSPGFLPSRVSDAYRGGRKGWGAAVGPRADSWRRACTGCAWPPRPGPPPQLQPSPGLCTRSSLDGRGRSQGRARRVRVSRSVPAWGMLVGGRTPEVVVVGLRVGAVPAVACCLALVVSACSGADSGGGQPASSCRRP